MREPKDRHVRVTRENFNCESFQTDSKTKYTISPKTGTARSGEKHKHRQQAPKEKTTQEDLPLTNQDSRQMERNSTDPLLRMGRRGTGFPNFPLPSVPQHKTGPQSAKPWELHEAGKAVHGNAGTAGQKDLMRGTGYYVTSLLKLSISSKLAASWCH